MSAQEPRPVDGAAPPDGVARVKKAPPRKKGKADAEAAPLTGESLRATPLFASLDAALASRLAERVTRVEVERGATLLDAAPAPDDASLVFVVLAGHVSAEREAERGLETVNYLTPGEVYVQKLFADDRTRRVRLTAMVPVTALRIAYADLNYVLKKSDAVRDAFSDAVRAVTERQASRFDQGFQREIARFFVEQRLTFAGRVKIKRMDICIECDGCYDACRDRHGTDRLGATEVKYGLTEVPANCHNCGVPECLDKCKFGHLSRHPDTQEIVISHDCIGCTACARGCSFGAIRMHAIADLDMARYFPGRAADAKGKNIAQKCDNCSGHADQACITACPTGALFQVDGARLFDAWPQFAVHRAGAGGAAAAVPGVPAGWRRFWVTLFALNALFLSFECFGRLFWPAQTFGTWLHAWGITADGLNPVAPFRAGDWFSHALGWGGAGFLLATQLYRFGKAYAPRFGSVQVWMESHVWLGALGGLWGLFHTTFLFNGLFSVTAFVTMSLALLTGIVGRYVLYLVPRSGAGAQLELRELELRLGELDRELEGLFDSPRAGMTMMTRVADLVAAESAAAAAENGEDRESLVQGLLGIAGEDQALRRRIEALRADLERGGVRAGKAKEALALMRERFKMERSIRRHAFLGRLLKRYRVVHVVASNVMFGALLLHVVVALAYAVGN